MTHLQNVFISSLLDFIFVGLKVLLTKDRMFSFLGGYNNIPIKLEVMTATWPFGVPEPLN